MQHGGTGLHLLGSEYGSYDSKFAGLASSDMQWFLANNLAV